MMDAVKIMRLANIAKAAVKSSHPKGALLCIVVNSIMMMKRVTMKQKHQVNMHHDQYELVTYPTEATRLKEIHVKMAAKIRKMPTGWVSARKSTRIIVTDVEIVLSDMVRQVQTPLFNRKKVPKLVQRVKFM